MQTSAARGDLADFLANVVLPLRELLVPIRPRIVGISGAAGAGKTTLANSLRASLTEVGQRVLCVSLDDFCFGRVDRLTRGHKWRAVPGSHDTALLDRCLETLAAGISPVEVPTYDKLIDDRGPNLRVEPPVDLVIFDGWFIGYQHPLYLHCWRHVDFHIHINLPMHLARQRRFKREEELRSQGGGLTDDHLQQFWDEVLEPISSSFVRDAGLTADITLEVKDVGDKITYELIVPRA